MLAGRGPHLIDEFDFIGLLKEKKTSSPPFALFDSLIHKFINSSNSAHSSFVLISFNAHEIKSKRRGGWTAPFAISNSNKSIMNSIQRHWIHLICGIVDWLLPPLLLLSPLHASFSNCSIAFTICSFCIRAGPQRPSTLFISSFSSLGRAEMKRNEGVEWPAAKQSTLLAFKNQN